MFMMMMVNVFIGEINLFSYPCLFLFLCSLGTVSEFRRKYENPILRGRDADASDSDQKKGEEKLSEVNI